MMKTEIKSGCDSRFNTGLIDMYLRLFLATDARTNCFLEAVRHGRQHLQAGQRLEYLILIRHAFQWPLAFLSLALIQILAILEVLAVLAVLVDLLLHGGDDELTAFVICILKKTELRQMPVKVANWAFL